MAYRSRAYRPRRAVSRRSGYSARRAPTGRASRTSRARAPQTVKIVIQQAPAMQDPFVTQAPASRKSRF